MKTILFFFLLLSTAIISNSQSRIVWKFLTNDPYIQGRPGIAADGTIYALGINGHLYALTPQGKLQWTYTVDLGSVQSVSVGNNGTIYFAGGNIIYALNPDGTLKWKVADPSGSLVDAGPSIGPDGNIYAVTSNAIDANSLGVFSLTPNGAIRWNKNQIIEPQGASFQTREIVFSVGQLYVAGLSYKGGGAGLLAFKMNNGNFVWRVAGEMQPGIGPDGRIIVKSGGLSGSEQISAYNTSGTLIKNYFGSARDLSSPDVGKDGVFYVEKDYSFLTAENPDATEKFSIMGKGFLNVPAVNTSNTLVAIGGSDGTIGYMAGVSTAGKVKWRVSLPLTGTNYSVPVSKPMFSANDSVLYEGTFEHLGGSQSYFYAIATGATAGLIQKEQTAYADNIVENALPKKTTTKFYPNPAKNNLYIQFYADAQSSSVIIITDMQGKIVFQKAFTSVAGDNNFNINISSLSSGSYILTLQNGTDKMIQKIIKQ